LLERRSGVVLTDAGREVVTDGLGITCTARFRRAQPDSVPDELEDLLKPMRCFCEARPRVDVTLDQSHATPETALRRAVYLLEVDALEGRDLLLLGDDDLTSLAVGLVARQMGLRLSRVVVVECDERLVDFLCTSAEGLGMPMEVLSHDLRSPLPDEMQGAFEAFLTDPPYTLEGLSLFVSRGVSALRPGPSRPAIVCFGHRAPDEAAEVIRRLTGMGLAPIEILRGFNRYVGAQLLAGTSQLIGLSTTAQTHPEIAEDYSGKLYTADGRRRSADRSSSGQSPGHDR
jgi:predicted methyltransferase